MMEMLFFLSPLIKPNKLSISLGPRGFCAFPSNLGKKGRQLPLATVSSKTLCLYAAYWCLQRCIGGNVKQQLAISCVRRKGPTQFSTGVDKLFD